MSELQIALLLIGLVVLVAMAIYNGWRTRQSLPKTMRERPTGPRQEPRLEGEEPAMAEASEEASTEAPALVADPLPVIVPERRLGLDDLIDSIAPLIIEHPVSGDALLAALPGTRRVGSKPFAVEGLNDATQDWEHPRAGERYSALQVGIQLANRSGPLNEIEFSEFVVKTQAYADAVGAAVDFPDMRTEVSRARELDAFASQHDAQLGFVLRAGRAAWSPGFVVQTASQMGFVAGAVPGRLVLPSQRVGHSPVLSLLFDSQVAMAEESDQAAVRELQLLLDVTRVPREDRAFVQLCQVARALATAMEGQVTDDNGRLLTQETIDAIGRDLEGLYDELDARDLSAGSDQARRLFA
jgi:ZipA, C-terminal FtsZ-binding domain